MLRLPGRSCGGVKTPPYSTSENGLPVRKTAWPPGTPSGRPTYRLYDLPERLQYNMLFAAGAVRKTAWLP